MNRLELLKKKQKGKLKMERFFSVFEDIKSKDIIALEESSKLLLNLSERLDHENSQFEIINDRDNIHSSNFIVSILEDIIEGSKCYVFTDDFEYCGVFKALTQEVLINVFKIAENDINNTCFVLDENFNYYLRINYYDANSYENPNSFEIERTMGIKK